MVWNEEYWFRMDLLEGCCYIVKEDKYWSVLDKKWS